MRVYYGGVFGKITLMKKKIAVALSGGVDSGVAAALLVKEGYQCTGFHLHFWKEPPFALARGGASEGPALDVPENKCCSLESLTAARKTAQKLGMPFYTLDFSQLFKQKVVDYFLQAYSAGLTPNPCVMCNKFVKFGRLLDYVLGAGFDYLATGHYARTAIGDRQKEIGKSYSLSPIPYHLLSAKDQTKDQTYFLYNLTQRHLAHLMFPVGEYTKKQVWQMAKQWRLPVAARPESQEICFLPENDYRPFLQRHVPASIKPGRVINVEGKTIGRHQGLPLYTIGQRHGFEITNKKVLGPFYVIAKKVKRNQLVVGFGRETERQEFDVQEVNWISGQPPKLPLSCQVRLRHQGELLGCQVFRVSSIQYRVSLTSPQRGLAPGQAAVFYRRGAVLGGGMIAD